jgi:glycosyltransferase involved in cell wall biosynthesis
VVKEPRRGYGRACLKGLEILENPDIIVFLDGDYSDDPGELGSLIQPVIEGKADFVVGSRVLGRMEKGAMTPVQRYGNWLASILLNLIFRTKFTDLGPFRAIRWDRLKELKIRDKKFGWTVEMQIKAAAAGLKSMEIPVSYRRRKGGKSKVSGTVKGVFFASIYIMYYIGTAAVERLLKRY